MKNIFAKENIGSQVYNFLGKSEKSIFNDFKKSLSDYTPEQIKTIYFHYSTIYKELKKGFIEHLGYQKEIDKAIEKLIVYCRENKIKYNELMEFSLYFRFILVKKLFTEKYDNTHTQKIWTAVINKLDAVCNRMNDYAFLVEKQHMRETEAKYRKMVASIQEGLISLDKNLIVTFCNKTICTMLGGTIGEILHKPVKEFLTEKGYEDIKKNLKYFKKQTEEKGKFTIEYTYQDGKKRMFEITPYIIKEKDKYAGLQATVRDITENVLLEQKLSERYEKMQQAYLELGKVNRQMASLIDVSSIASTDLKPAEIFHFILSSIAILSEADTATLRVYNETNKSLRMVAIYKMHTLWDNLKTIQTKGTYSGDALAKMHPVVVPDVREIKRNKYLNVIMKSGLLTMYSSPLIVGGKSIGVLNLYSATPGKFNELNHDLISALVGQAGLAVKLYA